MGTPLTAGNDIQLKFKNGNSGSTNYYPITKSTNVFNASGDNLDEIIGAISAVPALPSTSNSLTFLGDDKTWRTIQDASTSQKGVVQLTNATDSTSETLAATAKAVSTVAGALSTFTGTTAPATYVAQTAMGVAGGVATLDSNTGKVPESQLPSYVDDVVEGYKGTDANANKFYSDSNKTTEIDIESGKIYIDLTDNITYRWSGSALVKIASSLALGETESTAYRGDRGKTAYDHSQAAHARADATKVTASETNGKINVYATGSDTATEVTVYTHPTGATATNPHGTTASDVGLGNVENKSGSTLRDEYITQSYINTTVGDATPGDGVNTGQKGIMTLAQANKLNNCIEMEIVAANGSPSIGTGLILQIVDTTPAQQEEQQGGGE